MKHLASILLIALVPLAAHGQQTDAAEAYRALESDWNDAWQASDVHTVQEYETWIDRFWQFRNEHEGTEAAAEVTARAFDLISELKDPQLMREKYDEVPVNEPAKANLMQYVPRLLFDDPMREWRRVAEESSNAKVRAAALFHVASYYDYFARYGEAKGILDTLATDYGVTVEDAEYGSQIQAMHCNRRRFYVGNELPTLRTVTIDGESVSTSELKGSVVLLYFYGTTCGSCVKMYPTLNRLQSNYADEDFYLLGISIDRDRLTEKQFRTFLDEYDISWPQTLEVELFEQFNVNALSTAILLDRQGRIVRLGRAEEVLSATETLKETSVPRAVETLLDE